MGPRPSLQKETAEQLLQAELLKLGGAAAGEAAAAQTLRSEVERLKQQVATMTCETTQNCLKEAIARKEE